MTITVVKSCILAMWLGSLSTSQQTTIPDAARASREKVVHLSFLDDASPLPLRSLVDRSTIIVLGQLSNERSYLSTDQTRILTDYDVRPTKLLYDKAIGALKQPQELPPLLLTVFGGRLEIAGKDVWLEDTTRLTWDPGSVLLLFLKREASPSGKYVLSAGNAGLFRVNDQGQLRSLLRHKGDDGELEGLSLEDLPQRIDVASR